MQANPLCRFGGWLKFFYVIIIVNVAIQAFLAGTYWLFNDTQLFSLIYGGLYNLFTILSGYLLIRIWVLMKHRFDIVPQKIRSLLIYWIVVQIVYPALSLIWGFAGLGSMMSIRYVFDLLQSTVPNLAFFIILFYYFKSSKRVAAYYTEPPPKPEETE